MVASTPAAITPASTRAWRWPWLALLAALGFAALVLSPMLSSGFLGDDVANSVTTAPSTLLVHGTSLPGAILDSIVPWIRAGRLFPGTAYAGVLFYLVDGSALGLKAFVFVLILVDLALLGSLVVLLTRSVAAAALSIAIVPIALQVRAPVYHDPVVAFAGLLPLVTCYLLASLCLFALYLRSGRRRFLFSSLGLYGLALLTYEITIAFVIVYPALAWVFPARRPIRAAIGAAAPFAALVAAVVVVVLALRLSNPAGFALTSTTADYARSLADGADPAKGAYAPDLDPVAIAKTLVLQCFGALPFSYALFAAPKADATLPTVWEAVTARPAYTLALMVLAAVLLAAAVRSLAYESRSTPRLRSLLILVGVGVALVVLPNVLIALSPRYQREVHLGKVYLPVLVSCFGFAVLVGALLNWLLATLSSRPRPRRGLAIVTIAVVVALTGVGVVNAEINRRSVEAANQSVWYAREIAATAMREGLMADVPEGATLATSDMADFVAANAGVAVRTTWSADPVAWLPTDTPTVTEADGSISYEPSDSSPIYYLGFAAAWHDNGFAFVGRIRSIAVATSGGKTLTLDTVRLYVSDTPLAADAAPPLYGQRSGGYAALDPKVIGLDPSSVDVMRSGASWKLFETKPGVDLQLGT